VVIATLEGVAQPCVNGAHAESVTTQRQDHRALRMTEIETRSHHRRKRERASTGSTDITMTTVSAATFIAIALASLRA
jgi:hypothetical protein